MAEAATASINCKRSETRALLSEQAPSAIVQTGADPSPSTGYLEEHVLALLRQSASRPRHFRRVPHEHNDIQQPWAGPLVFDESGYPVQQAVPSLANRVRRLLSTG